MENAQRFLDENGISQTEVAGWYDVEPSTISRKLSGSRRWTAGEVNTFLERSSKRLGRRVTYEEVSGGPKTRRQKVSA
jgi:DNA transposition AAA+ family ATPase